MAHNNYINAPAPNVPYFAPAQYPPAGTALDPQPNGKPIATLFKPLKIRGVEFQNRIFLSPLCQYSSENGKPTPWQFAHLGGILTRGPGLTMVEATSVVPEGRITPQDAGIWNDEQMEAWREIVQFAHAQNQKIGIQLAHAGRKASTVAPWIHSRHPAPVSDGGWPDDIWGPSAIPYSEDLPAPKELTKDGIKRIVNAFGAAAKRSLKAGFDVIEVHTSHGYLIGEFMAPVANHRTDEYGGSFENRIRLLVEVVDAIRAVIPPSMPLFVRVSATDWLEESHPEEHWGIEDTVKLAEVLAAHGVDLLDISSAGLHPAQKFQSGKHRLMHAPLSAAVRKAHGDKILVSVVGMITTGELAQSVLDEGAADVVFVGRQFQKNPGTVWAFAEELGVTIKQSHQIEWGVVGRAGSMGRPAKSQ
ncbi:FMN-linked oxidoreductase [Daedalea quercina L-15889]|uniref:FMN-linked oxidoreductase n=1 Tax=Daedalea quercina L-15889 TaxID=1314783 RepID=A0A165MXH6_9APHY|nr:FMN-linked oxidoreductase [Daedalea quercina L-15889]